MLCNIVICCFCMGAHTPAIYSKLSLKKELHEFLFLCTHACDSVPKLWYFAALWAAGALLLTKKITN